MKKKVILFTLIFIGTLFYFFANFQRIAIPGAIFDLLQQDLSAGAPYITAFGAIFMYIYAFNQLVIGVLVDKYGGLRVILAGGLIITLGALLFPLSSNLMVMYLARGLVGLGASTFYLSLIKELKEYFSDKNFGIAISVMLCIGYSGGIAANAPFVFMMKYTGWRELLIIFSLLFLIAWIIFAVLCTKVSLPQINKKTKLRILPFRLVFHKQHNRNLFSFACCNFGIFYAIQTIIGKKFLEDFCNLSTNTSAIILSTMAIVAAAFNIINAYICKLCKNQRVLFLKNAALITFACMAIICFCLILDIKSYALIIVFFIISANASLSSLLVPVLHLTNRKMVSSTAVSIMNFCFFTMVGLLGTAMGFLLNIFPNKESNNVVVYSNQSYLAVFGMFLILSVFELYKAKKLSNKY